MIYTFNAKDNVRYSAIKSSFDLSDEDVYKTIQDEFSVLQKRLSCKKVSYEKLKGALVPNQEVNMYETCLVVDWTQIDDCNYGRLVFSELLPLLDKDSTYSILYGDYIDNLHTVDSLSQYHLRVALDEVLVRCNGSRYQHSSQYFLIYFNRLTANQRERIVEGLLQYSWFTGFADLSHDSLFKSYISLILVHAFIKQEKNIIASQPSDYSDEVNVNMSGYPFEEHGFSFLSINEESFMPFLSYKIESILPDEDDVSFSFNAIFPKFDSLKKLKLIISDKKWYEYLTSTESEKKGKLLDSIGYGPDDREAFIRDIYKKICASYIYNLRQNEYGDLLFNVCIDLPTINGNYRKTIIKITLFPSRNNLRIVLRSALVPLTDSLFDLGFGQALGFNFPHWDLSISLLIQAGGSFFREQSSIF